MEPFLITPFRDENSEEAKAKFNELHSKTRSIIERTIGVLKNTFRCTLGARQLHYAPEKATQIVNVCCALHNLRLKYGMTPNELELADESVDHSSETTVRNDEDEDTAEEIRQSILRALF